jgi:transcription elongation factor S-II
MTVKQNKDNTGNSSTESGTRFNTMILLTESEQVELNTEKKIPTKKGRPIKSKVENAGVEKKTAASTRAKKAAKAKEQLDLNPLLIVDKPTHFHEQRIKNRCAFIELTNSILIGTNIEISVYNYTIRDAAQHDIVCKPTHAPFIVAYNNRLRSIWWNIQNNTQLRVALCNGSVDPRTLEKMTHVELNIDKWKHEIDAKIKRDQFRFTNNQRACTSVYTCRKCRSNRCTFYTVQIRSADEPMTVFVACLDCGKNWRD